MPLRRPIRVAEVVFQPRNLRVCGYALASEYRLVEAQVREKYKEVFDQIEEELREKWSAVWAEMGHDPARIQVKVEPQIRVSIQEEGAPVEGQEVEATTMADGSRSRT